MKKLTMKTKIGYGLGDLASNLVFQLTVIYLMYFYTDVLKIPAVAAGTIFLIARIWDAFNDPIMGLIIDKTKSKHGKSRFYLLVGAIPLALATIIMFYAPNISTEAKIIYAAITYIIWGMLYTLINIPYSSMTAQLTNDPHERTSLSSIRMLFMLLGVIIVSIAVQPILDFFTNEATGFMVVAILFALLSWIIFWLCFKLTKVDNYQDSQSDSYKFKEIFPLLMANEQLLIVTIASFIGNSAVFMRESAAIYYVSNNLNNPDLLPLFLVTVVIAMVGANLLIPSLTKKYDKKGTYLIGSGIGIVGSIIFYFIPTDNLLMIFCFAAISSFGIAFIPTLGWSMIPDTIDYGEVQTGIRAEGISYAIFSFSQKLATAISGFLIGLILSFTNYDPNLSTQTDLVLTGNLYAIAIIPTILVFISGFIILFYRINRQLFNEIQHKLKEK